MNGKDAFMGLGLAVFLLLLIIFALREEGRNWRSYLDLLKGDERQRMVGKSRFTNPNSKK